MKNLLPFLQIIETSTLVLLGCLSVVSIAVMLDRRRALKKEGGNSQTDLARQHIRLGEWAKLAEWSRQHQGLAGAMFLEIGRLGDPTAWNANQIDQLVRSFLILQRTRLEKGFNILATLGSNAPFVGLFGTVLGIIEAFAVLSANQGGTNTIMASIAEALIATAAGLFVAIPAVIAYNYLTVRLRNLTSDCESLKHQLLAKLAANLKP